MARNLVLFDPAMNCWGLVCLIKKTGWEKDRTVVGFYKTEAEAKEAGDSLREKFGDDVTIRVFEYSYAKDEADIIKLACIDAVMAGIEYICG
jgi:hypothetical protein